MKLSLTDLSLRQKDKLTDFAVNFAVAWLVAALVGPFFATPTLTLLDGLRIIMGVGLGVFLVNFSLSLVEEEKK